MPQETYNLVSVIALLIGFTLTIVSLWYVRGQVIAATRTRETDVLVRLYEISTREPLYGDFDVVWDIKNSENLTKEQRDSAMRASLFFEMVGAVTSERYINTVLIEEFFGSLVTGCYDSLRHFIETERRKPYNNNFALNFERLAQTFAASPRVSRAPGQHQGVMKKDIKRKDAF